MTTRELDLLQGTLDVLVLRSLSWGPKHGYAVARFIREGSNNTFRILDGALYTSLHRMSPRAQGGNGDLELVRGRRRRRDGDWLGATVPAVPLSHQR